MSNSVFTRMMQQSPYNREYRKLKRATVKVNYAILGGDFFCKWQEELAKDRQANKLKTVEDLAN